MPSDISEESMWLLKKFVVLIYKYTTDLIEVNETKKQLIAH